MQNPNERCLLHQAAFKHRDIIATSPKWLELERERELERIAKAKRDAAPIAEQNLLNSNEICLLHQAAFKRRDIIATSPKWLELERELELKRIAKAKRDAAPIAELQYLLNSNEICLLHQAAFKHRDIIATSPKWLELERERELKRIAKAKRDAGSPIAEQYLLNSNENERAMKNRLAIREQLQFCKAARRASRRAMNAMKKTVEIADGTSDFPLFMTATSKSARSRSRTVFENATGLQLVQETENDVREFLQSSN